jgi:hypothetical protein
MKVDEKDDRFVFSFSKSEIKGKQKEFLPLMTELAPLMCEHIKTKDADIYPQSLVHSKNGCSVTIYKKDIFYPKEGSPEGG